MAKLTLDIKNQTLTVRCDIDRIVENSVNYLEYEINTTSDWDGLTKKVIISYNNGKNSVEPEEEDNLIPYEAIIAPGFSVNVVGYHSEGEGEDAKITKRIMTNEVLIKVYPGGKTNGQNKPQTLPGADSEDRLRAVEQKVSDLETRVPTKEELQTIRDQNAEIQNSFTTINNTLGEHTTSISENASEIQQVGNNLATLESSIQEEFDEVNSLIGTTNSNLETTNSNLETLSQKVDGLKIASKVEDNVLYIYIENTPEEKEG